MNLPEWLGVIGAVLSIALALGAALALVRGSYTKARISALREDNDDLRARVSDMDVELERRKAKEDVMSAKVDKINSENQLLRDMVTQRAEVEKVQAAVQAHHQAAMVTLEEHHQASTEAWTKISDALTVLIEREKKP